MTLKRKSSVVVPTDRYGKPDPLVAVYDVHLDGRWVNTVSVSAGASARALEKLHLALVKRMVIDERRDQNDGRATPAERRVPPAIAARALTWDDDRLDQAIRYALAMPSRLLTQHRLFSIDEMGLPGFYEIYLITPTGKLQLRDRFGTSCEQEIKRLSHGTVRQAAVDVLRGWGFKEWAEVLLDESSVQALRKDPPAMSYTAIEEMEGAIRVLRDMRRELDAASALQSADLQRLATLPAEAEPGLRQQLRYNTEHGGGRLVRAQRRLAPEFASSMAAISRFLDYAKQCCVDGEAMILARGGVPDVSAYFTLTTV